MLKAEYVATLQLPACVQVMKVTRATHGPASQASATDFDGPVFVKGSQKTIDLKKNQSQYDNAFQSSHDSINPRLKAVGLSALMSEVQRSPEARKPIRAEETLVSHGMGKVVNDALIAFVGKLEQYVQSTLDLKDKAQMRGLPPTQQVLNNGVLRWESVTSALDQQRTLLAAATAAKLDPVWAEMHLDAIVQWHDAFVENFSSKTSDGRLHVFESIDFAKAPPDKRVSSAANLRLTYAIEGSAALAAALLRAADNEALSPERRTSYQRAAQRAKDFALAVGDTFEREFADPNIPGRYFLFEGGQVPTGSPEELKGISHNNSQTYLIKGMQYLAELDPESWLPRLEKLVEFIQNQRSPSGLLREFDRRSSSGESLPFEPDLVRRLRGFEWQVQGSLSQETVIAGHTVAGRYEILSALAAREGRVNDVKALLDEFVTVMNRNGAVHSSGLLANAFMLPRNVSEEHAEQLPWPEGLWQSDVLQQFLLHAIEAGVSLKEYEVETSELREGSWVKAGTLSLDRILAKGLDVIDTSGFDGNVAVKGIEEVTARGRAYADTINHKAETALALEAAALAILAEPHALAPAIDTNRAPHIASHQSIRGNSLK
jgi:hypothetical protein